MRHAFDSPGLLLNNNSGIDYCMIFNFLWIYKPSWYNLEEIKYISFIQIFNLTNKIIEIKERNPVVTRKN